MPYAKAQVAQAMVSIGQRLGAPATAIYACLEIGAGENTWVTDTCNSSNHCGIFQLSGSLQAQHDYRDYLYWIPIAYQTGFWAFGGLIKLAHEGYGDGACANGCQGAYGPGPTSGAWYYSQFHSEARDLYNQYAGSSPPSGSGTTGSGLPPSASSPAVDFSPLQDAITGSSAGDAMGPGTTKAQERAHHGYIVSHDTLERFNALSTFTTKGGK